MIASLKLRCGVVALAVSVACARSSAAECVGVLRHAGRTYVALRDAPRDSAVWVGVGGRFGTGTVARFVSGRDIVVLVSDAGIEQEIPLAAAVTRDGGVPPVGRATTPQRTIQLAARAAYQLIYDTGMAEVSGAALIGTLGPVRAADLEDASRWQMRLAADGGMTITDMSGGLVDSTELGPVHILVQPGMTLAEIAAKIRANAARLAELNPGFVNPASETMRRTVRVR